MADIKKIINDEIIIKDTENLKIDENKSTNPPFKVVKYCSICTFPEEYCEYSHDLLKKRKEFPLLIETNPQVTPSQTAGETLKVEEEKKNDPQKIEEPKKEIKEKKHKRINDKIHIKNTKRSKRKAVTVIRNVEHFGLDLKEVSKLLSKKFACSSSVSKDEENRDSIVMTGEFEDDLKDFLMEKFKILKEENFHIDRIKKKGENPEEEENN